MYWWSLRHPPYPWGSFGNPLVDMQAMPPTSRLDDPGIGVRGNGRRVLTYADLRSLFDDPDGREPGRTIELHLTGHMDRFAWSFNGIKFSDAVTHPIHLHGMWSDIEDDKGQMHAPILAVVGHCRWHPTGRPAWPGTDMGGDWSAGPEFRREVAPYVGVV